MMRGRALTRLTVLVVASVLPGCADEEPAISTPVTADPPAADATEVTVESVADGDSFAVTMPDGTEERVRLIGINAPERDECLADDARDALADLLGSGEILLERDVSDRDPFDRLLRYAFSPASSAGDVFVNQEMVRRGLVLAVAFPPDVTRQTELKLAQDAAQNTSVGLWNPEACGPPASTSVHIIEVRGDPPGPDGASLNGERVVIRNTGDDPVELTGWMLRDSSSSNRFRFPDGFVLPPDADVAVYSGAGRNSAERLYWDHDVHFGITAATPHSSSIRTATTCRTAISHRPTEPAGSAHNEMPQSSTPAWVAVCTSARRSSGSSEKSVSDSAYSSSRSNPTSSRMNSARHSRSASSAPTPASSKPSTI